MRAREESLVLSVTLGKLTKEKKEEIQSLVSWVNAEEGARKGQKPHAERRGKKKRPRLLAFLN